MREDSIESIYSLYTVQYTVVDTNAIMYLNRQKICEKLNCVMNFVYTLKY